MNTAKLSDSYYNQLKYTLKHSERTDEDIFLIQSALKNWDKLKTCTPLHLHNQQLHTYQGKIYKIDQYNKQVQVNQTLSIPLVELVDNKTRLYMDIHFKNCEGMNWPAIAETHKRIANQNHPLYKNIILQWGKIIEKKGGGVNIASQDQKKKRVFLDPSLGRILTEYSDGNVFTGSSKTCRFLYDILDKTPYARLTCLVSQGEGYDLSDDKGLRKITPIESCEHETLIGKTLFEKYAQKHPQERNPFIPIFGSGVYWGSFHMDKKKKIKHLKYFWHTPLYPDDLMNKIYKRDFRYKRDLALKTLLSIVSAVIAMKEEKVHHNDIKPENILIDKNLNPVIADYGLSTLAEDRECRYKLPGTPLYNVSPQSLRLSALENLYAKPEQCNKLFSGNDRWGLGSIAFIMISQNGPGQLPWEDLNSIEEVLDYICSLSPLHLMDCIKKEHHKSNKDNFFTNPITVLAAMLWSSSFSLEDIVKRFKECEALPQKKQEAYLQSAWESCERYAMKHPV